MFEWKVEEMKLMNDKTKSLSSKKIYACECEVSKEDKIQFVDSMTEGRLTYILDLVEKFKKDEDSLSKDKWDCVRTVSLKAWLRKNDIRNVCDKVYSYGQIYFFGTKRMIYNLGKKECFDTYEDYIDEVFHEQLVKCENLERKYFKEHDEYEILKEKFRNKNYFTTFGVHIASWSSGRICVVGDDDNERDITIDELKYLLSKYEELDRLVDKITRETKIVY